MQQQAAPERQSRLVYELVSAGVFIGLQAAALLVAQRLRGVVAKISPLGVENQIICMRTVAVWYPLFVQLNCVQLIKVP